MARVRVQTLGLCVSVCVHVCVYVSVNVFMYGESDNIHLYVVCVC